MKQLKKIMAFLLALVLLLPLCACADNHDDDDDDDDDEYPFESVIDNYFDFSFKGKYNKLEKLAPEAYWEYTEDELNMYVDDYIDELEDNEYYETMMEFLEEEYGDHIRISYKILEADELSETKLDTIKDGLKENYDIAKESVTKGYEVEIEATIKGDDDEDTDETELYVVKIDGKWYVVSESGTFDFGV